MNDLLSYISERSKVTDNAFATNADVRAPFSARRRTLLESGQLCLVAGCLVFSGMTAYANPISGVYETYRASSSNSNFNEANIIYLEQQARLAGRTANALEDLKRADRKIKEQEAYFSKTPFLPDKEFEKPANRSVVKASPVQADYIQKIANAMQQQGYSIEQIRKGTGFPSGVLLVKHIKTGQPTYFTLAEDDGQLLAFQSDSRVEMEQELSDIVYIRQLPANQRVDRYTLIMQERGVMHAKKYANSGVPAPVQGPSGP